MTCTHDACTGLNENGTILCEYCGADIGAQLREAGARAILDWLVAHRPDGYGVLTPDRYVINAPGASVEGLRAWMNTPVQDRVLAAWQAAQETETTG